MGLGPPHEIGERTFGKVRHGDNTTAWVVSEWATICPEPADNSTSEVRASTRCLAGQLPSQALFADRLQGDFVDKSFLERIVVRDLALRRGLAVDLTWI
jgi:hypothetical protein